jgi:hypothetical protein
MEAMHPFRRIRNLKKAAKTDYAGKADKHGFFLGVLSVYIFVSVRIRVHAFFIFPNPAMPDKTTPALHFLCALTIFSSPMITTALKWPMNFHYHPYH